MKEPEKILEAKDICKAYGKNMVLNQVNLTIKAGEIYGLVGENGAGKSSLMKVITGLTKPTSGEISLFGKKNLEDERNKIGCLIENPALYMDMTARQNLEIQRTQRGIPGKSSIDEVLEIMDLKDAGNKRVKAFSLGMKQRLGIAIALLGRPQLLILDEPINGLDPTKIKYVREVLKNMNEEDGTTILISSHILPELHQLATVYGFIHHAYICFSLLIKADFNAVICAVLLLLLIWAMDYLFSLCFKKNDLGISEKKRYIFMAYVGACISGFIIASRDASKMALEIPNITISVLIGAYVPFTLLLEDGKKGKVELQSMKEEWEEKYKKTFRERKVKDILSALLFAMVYGVLLVGALSPAQNIINDIASGIGMGMATVVVAFVGLVEVKNRLTKRRNKREDADQEKSDTE